MDAFLTSNISFEEFNDNVHQIEKKNNDDNDAEIDIDIDDFKFDLSQRQITKLNGEKLTNMLLSGDGFISESQFNLIQNKIEKLPSKNNDKENMNNTMNMDKDCDTKESTESLPVCLKSDDGTQHISIETINELMNGKKYKDLFDHFVIIDCRYKYEYIGGHINGSLNIQCSNLLKLLFKINFCKYNINDINNKRIAWILHCEYSQKRGPRAAKFIRNLDRTINQFDYPNLFLPHLYVLSGGYKKYYETNKKIGTYISMFDENYVQQMAESEILEKRLWPTQKQRNSKKGRKKQFKTQVLCLMFVSKLKKQAKLNKSLLLE